MLSNDARRSAGSLPDKTSMDRIPFAVFFHEVSPQGVDILFLLILRIQNCNN
jgi:hypothetical protein